MKSGRAAFPVIKITTRGLLFDMDGVLVSSLGSVERSWQKWAQSKGMDVAATIKSAHGRRAIDTLRALLPNGNHAAELKAIEDMEIADVADLLVLDGVTPILQSIPQRFWTIVTSATDRLARGRLSHAGIPVPEKIVTGDMVKLGKPNPEPYVKGAEMLGLSPEDCIVIEDSTSGARAGHAAGCRVLATTFSHSIAELSSADWIVASLAEVTVTVQPDGENLLIELPGSAWSREELGG